MIYYLIQEMTEKNPPSKNGKKTPPIDQPGNQQPVHRHNLRDRRGRRKIEKQDVPHMPAIIPISETGNIEITESEERGNRHYIIRVPLSKWNSLFTEEVAKIEVEGSTFTVSINNQETPEYLTIEVRSAGTEESMDIWGKVLWVSGTQINSKLIKKACKRISGQNPAVMKIKTSQILSDVFIDLYLHKVISNKAEMRGLINQGNTCYMNSYLQMLFHIGKLRNIVFCLNETIPGKFPATLQSVFYKLANDSKPVSTEQLSKSYGWTKKQTWVQQDIQEFSCLFFEVLQRKINEQQGIQRSFNQLFEGELTHYVDCIDIQYRSQLVERFIDLQLSVSGNNNLFESFKQYTEYQLLDGDNMYSTELYGKRAARKGIIINRIPPVLMVQLKRFQYNPISEANEKVLSRYEYPESIDFSPILGSKKPIYKLYAVLVHQGQKAESGHYYAYLRLNGAWHKFNDQVVTTATDREVFEYNFGGTTTVNQLDSKELVTCNKTVPVQSTAYMLVYYNSEMEKEIFDKSDYYPLWLKQQEEAKAEQDRQKKIKNDLVTFKVTDWPSVKSSKVSSCGLLKQTDTKDVDADFENYATQQLSKEELAEDYFAYLKKCNQLPSDTTFWVLDQSKDKEVLMSVYWRKQSPTINQLFRDCTNPMLLVLAGNRSVIKFNQSLKEYQVRNQGEMEEEVEDQSPKRNGNQKNEWITQKELKANEVVVCIVKLYHIGEDGQTDFVFDSYNYIGKDAKFSQLIGILKGKYQQKGYTCKYYSEGKTYELSEVEPNSFVSVDNSKNRLVRIIVEKIHFKASKSLPIIKMFEYQANKICVHIRSEDHNISIDEYLNKNLSTSQIRKFIFENVLKKDSTYKSEDYIILKTKQTKTSRYYTEVHEDTLQNILRYERTILFDKSTIKSSQRQDNAVIIATYRFKNLTKGQPISLMIPKNTNTVQMIQKLMQKLEVTEALKKQGGDKIRLILVDSLQQKVMRILAPDAEVQSLLSKSKGFLYVEADNPIENGYTVFCHHKSKTGEYIPIPFVLRCGKDIKISQLKQLIINYAKDIAIPFEDKVTNLNTIKLKLSIYGKGTSSSRAVQMLDDNQTPISEAYSNLTEVCVQITHLSLSKSIQTMKIKI